MNEQPSSASVASDVKKVLWISTLWVIFTEEEPFDRPSAEAMTSFLSSLVLPPITRPTLFQTWSGVIRRSIEEVAGVALTQQAILTIRRWAADAAKRWTATRLYEPRQARGLTSAELNRLISFLWFKQWTTNSFKCTALISLIAARTGKFKIE